MEKVDSIASISLPPKAEWQVEQLKMLNIIRVEILSMLVGHITHMSTNRNGR